MNQPIMFFTAAMLCLCMTGCSGGDQRTTQKDSVPITPAETTQFSVTGESSEAHTETVTTLTDTLNGQTETASAESRTSAAAETAPTAAASQTDAENSGNSAGTQDAKTLYGKWETVSFAKSTGERVTYDLSDPVHRSYYVGLDLRSVGQSALTVGTERFPATIAVNGDTLFVWKAAGNSCSMDFQISRDRDLLTVELMNGRITATLKPVRTDFAIKPYQKAAEESEYPFSASDLTGDWSMPGTFGSRNNTLHVNADGSVILRYAAGGSRSGTVRIDREDQTDGTPNYYYSLCDDTGIPWMRFPCVTVSADHIYTEDGGTEFVRLSFADIAVEKMENLNFLMSCMSGGGGDLEIDRDMTVKVADEAGGPDRIYALVRDERFAINSLGKAAFEWLLEETTSVEARAQWQAALDDCLIEQDGQTYVLISQAHGFYRYETEHGVTVTEESETAFSAETRDSDMMNGRGSAHFVYDGSGWIIDSYAFN
ncbi:MAG: hypothetical protein IJM46_12235 [Oscillospiraceae bacterium]|nr:hypothetical protein [Oscillospiraceae bacterium]